MEWIKSTIHNVRIFLSDEWKRLEDEAEEDDEEEGMPPEAVSTPTALRIALAHETGIDRPVMNQKQYEEEYGDSSAEAKRVPLRRHLRRAARQCLTPCSSAGAFGRTLISFVPIVTWLPKYDFKRDFVADIIGGITTGIMHVPQGLAYAALAGVDPVYGLYSSCFPAFFYMLFGTSRHTSIGSFAVVTLMAGFATDNVLRAHADSGLTAIQVSSTLAFAVGVLQFASGILRLEFLTTYFSDPLVSGFTTGAAVHVLFAQIDDVFGLTNLPKNAGPGYIFPRAANIFWAALDRTNWVVFGISAVSIAFLDGSKTYLSPFLKKRGLKIPMPFELILIIITTTISWALDLRANYNVPVVGYIPTGPPVPALPIASIIPECLVQSLGMTVVAVAVHISMAKMIAKKLGYAIEPRQELYALGATGVLGSLFSIYPVSTTLGRTMVNVSAGTKTQLSTIFSCTLLLILILWLGPLLESLPMCILASVIIVAVKPMFQRCEEIKTLWRVSPVDLLVWTVAVVSTIVIDVLQGLAIAILFALLTIIFRSQWPKWERVLGEMTAENPQQGLPEESTIARPTVCVFRFDAPLLFTNVERFVGKVKKTVDEWDRLTLHPGLAELSIEDGLKRPTRVFILDCSGIVYIDYMGIKAISETASDLPKAGFTVYLAAVRSEVLRAFRAQGLLDRISKEQLFPTLHDALSIADRNAAAMEMLTAARRSQLMQSPLTCGRTPIDGASPSPPSLATPSLPLTPTGALPIGHLLCPSPTTPQKAVPRPHALPTTKKT